MRPGIVIFLPPGVHISLTKMKHLMNIDKSNVFEKAQDEAKNLGVTNIKRSHPGAQTFMTDHPR
jgi:hypothetical protein